jgi:hypothetical protein
MDQIKQVISSKGLTNRNDLPTLNLVKSGILKHNQISNPIISLIVKATEMIFDHWI